MEEQAESAAREVAIDTLQAHQNESAELLRVTPRLSEEQQLEQALECARRYQDTAKPDGQYLRIGCLKYPPNLEKLRWQRTENVIRRVRPGIDEDPRYLAEVAREAASLEVVISKAHTGSPDPMLLNLCDHVLLGTTADPEVDASSEPKAGYVLVLLRNGLIEFLYQAAKATVLSWRPIRPKPGTSGGMAVSIADVERILQRDHSTLELLSRTLHSYMFRGLARPRFVLRPPPKYVCPLELLTIASERFVIAHEYGHALWQHMNAAYTRPPGISEWGDEFNADFFAWFFTTISGDKLDLLPPNVALQGGFFVLYALEILRKTRDLIQFGSIHEDKGTKSHPPNERRIDFLRKLYTKQNFKSNDKLSLDVEDALVPGKTLEYLWSKIQYKFLNAFRQRRPLFPLWEIREV
jgi:hypothetical protein